MEFAVEDSPLGGVVLQVSDFVALINQTLEFAYPSVEIEGEVAGFTISKGKWVFFDLKDEESTINCFMSVYQLKQPIEDGMRIKVKAAPKLTKWGRFSVTVQAINLVGEGSLRRAFELLKTKFEKEGLFADERKRQLPRIPQRIGVISSEQAAGYADFLKILNARWGGVDVLLADVQVQGDAAPGQITRAIDYFNQQAEPVDVLVIIRGGGSLDDLQAFNTEVVVRAIAGSRAPTLVGVGHETDVSLADMVADVRAATPSNAAEIVVPDKQDLKRYIDLLVLKMPAMIERTVEVQKQKIADAIQLFSSRLLEPHHRLELLTEKLNIYNPKAVLQRGYSLVKDTKGAVVTSAKHLKKGDDVVLELSDGSRKATVKG